MRISGEIAKTSDLNRCLSTLERFAIIRGSEKKCPQSRMERCPHCSDLSFV